VVDRQQAYARKLGVPWGISESAYNARDLDRTYQYSSFGVPGLGLKRGLSENTVVAPYATALAAMVRPHAAVRNFARLEHIDARGLYGFYEALDYTARRLQAGEPFAIVRAYMAHHQGMTIVALANTLLDGLMRKRFHAEPRIKATELLLQERTPREVSVPVASIPESAASEWSDDFTPVLPRTINTPHHVTPRTRVLSNGHYAVMLTAAGSGYSQWHDLAVTRWAADVTCDASGSYLFLRDVETERHELAAGQLDSRAVAAGLQLVARLPGAAHDRQRCRDGQQAKRERWESARDGQVVAVHAAESGAGAVRS
jgi:cyclic beta-1,2-glucan synthetase